MLKVNANKRQIEEKSTQMGTVRKHQALYWHGGAVRGNNGNDLRNSIISSSENHKPRLKAGPSES